MTLLSGCESFRWDSAKLLSPLGSPGGKLLQYEGSAQDQIIQDFSPFKPSQRLYRTKRHRELVRTQPHLVHNMAVPEIEESSRSNARVNLSQLKLSSTASQDTVRTRMEENLKAEDEMEVKMRLFINPTKGKCDITCKQESTGPVLRNWSRLVIEGPGTQLGLLLFKAPVMVLEHHSL